MQVKCGVEGLETLPVKVGQLNSLEEGTVENRLKELSVVKVDKQKTCSAVSKAEDLIKELRG